MKHNQTSNKYLILEIILSFQGFRIDINLYIYIYTIDINLHKSTKI